MFERFGEFKVKWDFFSAVLHYTISHILSLNGGKTQQTWLLWFLPIPLLESLCFHVWTGKHKASCILYTWLGWRARGLEWSIWQHFTLQSYCHSMRKKWGLSIEPQTRLTLILLSPQFWSPVPNLILFCSISGNVLGWSVDGKSAKPF